MNIRGGVSIPQDQDLQLMGSWMPVTPEKPIPTRSKPIPVDRDGNQLGRATWQELNGLSNGYAAEMPNCNGFRQNSNLIGEVVQSDGYNSYGGGLADKNEIINPIAGSYQHASHNDGTSWKSDSLTKLLLMHNAGLIASANRNLNRSVNMAASRPLIPNLHSRVDCNQEGSFSGTPMFSNQNHFSGLRQLSNFANRPVIPDMPYQVDSNLRDSNPGSLLFRNQNHYPGSNSLRDSLLLSQMPIDSYSIPYQSHYDLTSPPMKIDAASSVTNTLQFTPITPDQANKLESNLLSGTLNIAGNGTSNEEEDNETSVASLGNKASQQQSDELLQSILGSSSAAIYTLYEENKESEKGSNQGIDLNKTPQQKPPKRRKHRPKVIKEGKPKKTPMPATPKNAKATPTGKRKYVRKNVLKELATEQAEAKRETVDPNGKNAAKSCRRVLNFDLEKPIDESHRKVVGDGEQEELQCGNKRAFSLSLDSQATELCFGTYNASGTKSAVQIDQWKGLAGHYLDRGTKSNLTFSTTHLQTDNIPLQERQTAAPLAPAKDLPIEDLHLTLRNVHDGYADPSQNSSSKGHTPLRSKREHFTIDHTRPNIQNPMVSLLCQKNQLGECQRTGQILGTVFPETHKRKKTDSRLPTDIAAMPCATAVEDSLGKAKTRQIHDNGANGFTTNTDEEILNSYFQSEKIGERQSEANKLNTERCNPSMAMGKYMLMQHRSSELHSHTEKLELPNILTSGHSFPSIGSVEDHHPPLPSPPKEAPELGNGQVLQASDVHMLATKQTLGCTSSRPVSSGSNRVRKNQDASNDYPDYQKPAAKRRGRPPKRKISPISIDEIMHQLQCLNLNERSNQLIREEQNAVVLYKGDGALVPYAGFELIKKRKPRPKVDLDLETDRIWNLLMGKEASQGVEGTDKEKEKWWEEERKVFRGRTDSFIARMHLIQGDRRFSRWKGSVVDSVIGVFLTQNVSDHLSSSAFMSLAARFPLKSRSDRTCDEVGTSILLEESEVCIPNQDDAIRWNVKVLAEPTYNYSSVTHLESTEHQKDIDPLGIERKRILEAHSQSMEDEVVSSQDSFESSVIQGTGGPRSCSGSNSEEEDFINGCRSREIHFPTLTNLLLMEKTTFQEFYSHGNSCTLVDEGSRHLHKQSGHTDSAPNNRQIQLEVAPSSNYQLHMNPDFGAHEGENREAVSEESIYPWPSIDFGFSKVKDANNNGFRSKGWAGSDGESTELQNGQLWSHETPGLMGLYVPFSNHSGHQDSISQSIPHIIYNRLSSHTDQHDLSKPLHLQSPLSAEPVKITDALTKRQKNTMQHVPIGHKFTGDAENLSVVNQQGHIDGTFIEPNSNEQAYSSGQAYSDTRSKTSKAKKERIESEKKSAVDWDILRKQVKASSGNKERRDTHDSLDYEAVRSAEVNEISEAIKERGMNNMLAERIKGFLNRLVREHGSIDLEWLRDVPSDKAKDYLLSIRGLGLKSVECVRLLTLHHLAFPVDTNVGRIAVRLGWVPLQPLPESLQLHLLEMYPVLESIQKYLWPRLCKLDQRTLYELHYQLITFGKVFCTKSKPNCNACPMRGECRHFASAFASARLALPGPEEKSIVNSTVPIADERNPAVIIHPLPLPPLENNSVKETGYESRNCEPIIEEPATPQQEFTEISESDIEDSFNEDPDEIPTINLNIEEFTVNLQNYMQEKMELQEGDMSKALVALNPEAASIPTPKLKNVSRLRTEHQVYELPDSHPLLEGMDRREPDDPSPYLLAIWTPGETANSIQPPETRCGSQELNKLCNEKTCFSCNSVREANAQTVRGTLLVPCRTAMRGSFPLNGTYFQVNEVFADHESSLNPIDVPRSWIWSLRRRTVYFGTSVSTIFKGLSTEGIQLCFWRGFVCVRGFDQKIRAPRPLMARLHFPASKLASQRLRTKAKQDMKQR